MSSEKLEEGWVRVRLNDSRNADLRCLKDSKGTLVKIFDYQGNELKFNLGAQYVVWQDSKWKY